MDLTTGGLGPRTGRKRLAPSQWMGTLVSARPAANSSGLWEQRCKDLHGEIGLGQEDAAAGVDEIAEGVAVIGYPPWLAAVTALAFSVPLGALPLTQVALFERP